MSTHELLTRRRSVPMGDALAPKFSPDLEDLLEASPMQLPASLMSPGLGSPTQLRSEAPTQIRSPAPTQIRSQVATQIRSPVPLESSSSPSPLSNHTHAEVGAVSLDENVPTRMGYTSPLSSSPSSGVKRRRAPSQPSPPAPPPPAHSRSAESCDSKVETESQQQAKPKRASPPKRPRFAPDVEEWIARSTTAFDMLQGTTNVDTFRCQTTNVLGTGCPIMDKFLNGGFRTGITEIVGESATAKSNFCLQMLLQAQLPRRFGGLNGHSVYVCTEGGDVPIKRLRQLAQAYSKLYAPFAADKDNGEEAPPSDFLQRIFVESAQTIEEQVAVLFQRLPLLFEQWNVRVLVLDSMAALVRYEFDDDEIHRRAALLVSMASQLKWLSSRYGCPILVVNQVSDAFSAPNAMVQSGDMKSSTMWPPLFGRSADSASHPALLSSGRYVKPALGLAWANCVNSRILLTRSSRSHAAQRSSPDGDAADESKSKSTPDVNIERRMYVGWSPYLPTHWHRVPCIEDLSAATPANDFYCADNALRSTTGTTPTPYCLFRVSDSGICGEPFPM